MRGLSWAQQQLIDDARASGCRLDLTDEACVCHIWRTCDDGDIVGVTVCYDGSITRSDIDFAMCASMTLKDARNLLGMRQ